MKIYTKTGDKGETSLLGGARVPKYHLRIDTYGTVDELNSWVGLLGDDCEDPTIKGWLKDLQSELFNIGSNLAVSPDKRNVKVPELDENLTRWLEEKIDEMEQELEPLKNFILPGGHRTVSHCHITRCVCRRAERLVAALASEEPVNDIIIRTLNRLSDFFFVLSRKLAHDLGTPEHAWKPRG